MTSMAECPVHGGAQRAAQTALETSRLECRAAGINPNDYANELTELVISEVKDAFVEMARDQRSGGPVAAFALQFPSFQNIYIADAGRRGAHLLLSKLGIACPSPGTVNPRPATQHVKALIQH